MFRSYEGSTEFLFPQDSALTGDAEPSKIENQAGILLNRTENGKQGMKGGNKNLLIPSLR
jgi:hypothetical protein